METADALIVIDCSAAAVIVRGKVLDTTPFCVAVMLLVPIASDADPAAVFDVNKLVALSQIASGTRHPLPLNLLSPESKSLPVVYSDQEGHTIFAANMKTPSGPMPIAIVVNGTAAQ